MARKTLDGTTRLGSWTWRAARRVPGPRVGAAHARAAATDRREFAVLWNACADMSSYVERSFTAITSIPAYHVQPLWSGRTLSDAQAARGLVRANRPQGETHHSLSLEDILAREPARACWFLAPSMPCPPGLSPTLVSRPSTSQALA